jgi:hypothetical protein
VVVWGDSKRKQPATWRWWCQHDSMTKPFFYFIFILSYSTTVLVKLLDIWVKINKYILPISHLGWIILIFQQDKINNPNKYISKTAINKEYLFE